MCKCRDLAVALVEVTVNFSSALEESEHHVINILYNVHKSGRDLIKAQSRECMRCNVKHMRPTANKSHS